MRNTVLKNWQRSWGATLALLAMLAWCMPTLAIGCAMSSTSSAVLLDCNGMNSGNLADAATMQQMPCCHRFPLPRSFSTLTHPVAFSVDGHLQVLSVSYLHLQVSFWVLLSAAVNYDVDTKVAFPLDHFSHPPAVHVASQLHGRAPPSLI